MNPSLLQNSSYLTGLVRRYPEFSGMDAVSIDLLESEIERVKAIPVDNLVDVKHLLRQSKARFDYIWCGLRFPDASFFLAGELAIELGTLRSEYAASTVNKALSAAWRDKSVKKFLPSVYRDSSEIIPGLFVLGMGKLGGYDLNFSSDIDLIAFYDPEILPISEMNGRTDVCARVLKIMTQALSENMGGEFVWRVDWRLRPDASVTPIVMSTPAATDFYHFRSLPWHRLAMIKARPIAGDIDAGRDFMGSMDSYIWRQNLDYSAVDDVRRLKQKINLEHPQLRMARDADAKGEDQANGFNLKLGKGGIREIEFIANAMQLLWGGKKAALKRYRTLDVLDALKQEALIEPDLVDTLVLGYTRLRLVEDAVQVRENQQVHALPQSTEGLVELETLLGIDAPESIKNMLGSITSRVSSGYQTLLGELSLDSSQDEEPVDISSIDWFESLPKPEKSIVQDWHEGFALYAVAPKNSGQLIPLYNQLVTLISIDAERAAELVSKLHRLFRATPKGGQYLRLLAADSSMLKGVLEPLCSSPAMEILLDQSPHIIDYLLEPKPIKNSADNAQITEFDSAFVLASDDHEIRLKRLRCFVNEQLYDRMLHLYQGKIGSIKMQNELTLLAEHCLDLGLQITAEDMGLEKTPIAILGMGKLGMKAMAPLSDLDLIFIAGDPDKLEQANRFSNRLKNLMETRTAEGRVYEMDTRLRPSGRSGPVTVSIDGFRSYHLNAARTWEQLALTPARAVAGRPDIQKQIERVRADILSRGRSRKQVLLDAAKMHSRVRSQRIDKGSVDFLNVKLRRGGMFETDYLCACLVLLHEFETDSALLEEYDSLIENVLSESGHPEVAEAVKFWRSLQIWSRMLGLESRSLDQSLNQIGPARLEFLLSDMQLSSPQELSKKIESYSELVGSTLEGLLAEVSKDTPVDWADWDETKIQWQ